MTSTVSAGSTRSNAKISADNLRYLCDTIYRESGIVLDESKSYLIEARLTPLARREGAETLDSLCNLIRATSGRPLRDKVVEAMTTNETLFFRDVKPFDALRQEIFPDIVANKRGSRTVRIWSAACSTGQEAYSIAMLWRELAYSGWTLEILGTDLSPQVLEKAAAGRYQQLEVNRGLPAAYLIKNFERQESEWVIKPELRRMVRWERFNLKDSMRSLGPFDLVFCRNVLIYFDQETKGSILRNIRGTLAPGGHLFLGSSETTINLDEIYERVVVGPAVAYKKPLASKGSL